MRRVGGTGRVLELTSAAAIRQTAKDRDASLSLWWEHYIDLARQRQQLSRELGAALGHACIALPLRHWHRAVKYQYSLHPLCTVGSAMTLGGRFNVGRQVNPLVPTFPALYLAEDRETATHEALGQPMPNLAMDVRDLTLNTATSLTTVSVSGHLTDVIDLTARPHLLSAFVRVLQAVTPSAAVRKRAASMRMKVPPMLTSVDELLRALLEPNWRIVPSQCDVPAASQIFGGLANDARLGGVLYASKITGKRCLAAFPQNFAADDWIGLDDEPPKLPGNARTPSRIDRSNFRLCEVTADDLWHKAPRG